MKSRLRDKFLLFFILLACIPVLALGGTILYLLDLAHRRDVSNLELQMIDQKEDEISKFFADTLGTLELRVESAQALENQASQPSWQERLVKGIFEANDVFQEISFIGLDGRETAKYSLFDPRAQLLYVADLPKFQEARSGKNFIGEVYHTLSGPMLTLAAPVRVGEQVIQVLSAEVSLSRLTKALETTRLGQTGYVALFGRNGVFISDRTREGIRPGFNGSQWDRISQALSGTVFTGLDQKDRYESIFGTGSVVGALKRLPEIGWVVAVEWPIKEADEVLRNVRNQVMMMTLASIVAVLLIAPLFAARLVRPIRELEMSTKEVEKGNLQTKVAIQTHDELEDLGNAFNTMVQGLKRLQELKEEFVFVAAHELRTPVTVIKGYASMLLEGDAGPLTKKVKSFLSQVEQANQRLLQLVEDLLEVARSEAGRLSIEVKDIDIRDPIQSTVGELALLAKKKTITLNYELHETSHVLADEGRVKEIMVNLVGNSIKYTPEKGRVRVFHEVREKELVTHVEDNGYGIPQEAQSKIFEKFYRVESPETRDITGTGLGLFIVKQLVEKMHGTIWLKSEHGKGTTFSFSLPIVS